MKERKKEIATKEHKGAQKKNGTASSLAGKKSTEYTEYTEEECEVQKIIRHQSFAAQRATDVRRSTQIWKGRGVFGYWTRIGAIIAVNDVSDAGGEVSN